MKRAVVFVVAMAGCVDAVDEVETGFVEQELNGDNWTTANTWAGLYGASGAAIAVSSTGKPFAVGSRIEADGGSSWVMRTTISLGWGAVTGATYQLAVGKRSTPRGMVINHATNQIFVTGWATDANDARHWVTRVGSVSGGAWTTVDDVATAPGDVVDVNGIALYNGRLFTLANINGSTRIRVSDDGITWNDGAPQYLNIVYTGLCSTNEGVMFVGQLVRPSLPNAWYTGVTSDGVTWSGGDYLSSSSTSYAATACGDVNGTTYIGGAYQTGSTRNWLVRKEVGGGFSSVNAYASPGYGAPASIGPGKLGRVYVAGQLGVPGNVYRWHVRRGESNGTVWLDSDQFVPNGATAAVAQGYAFDAATNTAYVVGWGGSQFNVRRLQ